MRIISASFTQGSNDGVTFAKVAKCLSRGGLPLSAIQSFVNETGFRLRYEELTPGFRKLLEETSH